MSFFEELKRRNVFRVGAAYAVIAWLLIQVADVLLPRLGAPEWFVNALMLVIVLGFPVALVIAWVFEVTPDGIVTQDAVDAGAKTTSGKKLNAVIISALLLAVIFMAVDNYVLDDSVPAPVTASTNTIAPNDEILETAGLDKSIAVLPFANLSNDPDQEFFSDGLAEELLNKLAQVGDLRVAARTSSFFYKGRNEDTREIGQALGVNYILEGSVRKGGNTLRITAQLIQADNGFHLWSETYDRELDDIFAIQDEIAEAVTMALSVTLRAGEFDRPGMTNNIEAYDHMLQAQALLRAWSTVSIPEAIDHARQAVQIDPQFAQGWINLFNAYNTGVMTLPANQTRNMRSLLDEATGKASAIAPDSPEVLLMSAINHMAAGRWLEEEAVLEELLTMDTPFEGEIYAQLGALQLRTGRLQDSLVSLQTAKRLAPYSMPASMELQHVLMSLNRDDEAGAELQRAVEFDLGGASELLERYGSAFESDDVAYFRSRISQDADLPEAEFINSMGDLLEADDPAAAIRAKVEELRNGGFNTPLAIFNLSNMAAMVGEPDLALSLREQALPFASTYLFFVWLDVNSDMRRLPGFRSIWRTWGWWITGAPPATGRTNVSPSRVRMILHVFDRCRCKETRN